ncbi:Uncharacterised protein [Legionella busanensis]|uniref:Uncharacterized protein n=1 Tax=Legionella busanensis TaxID=190655 RepID=A0A378JID8_9GAMM|nr:hypothetical protein [Legionella busanensis]STX49989.1 Uncharacterised protein [Legionella busanensis]
MNKNILPTLFVIGSIFTIPLSAANFFHKLMPSKMSNQFKDLHPAKQAKQQGIKYTNFSGNWSGNCVIGNFPAIPMDFTIENDAEYFSIDDEEFSIGALHTQGTSGGENNEAAFDHQVFEWNQDMSKLTLKGMSFEKYSDTKFNTTEAILTQMTLSLNNEKLIMEGQVIGFVDLEPQTQNVSCAFTKK